MKIPHLIYGLLLVLSSCKSHETVNEQKKLPATDSGTQKAELLRFFPVTDYIKGQIYEIKNGGINPFKIVITPGHKDSGWLKMESLDTEVADFLSPEIDSLNLTSLFSETKFIDQTLDALTLSYDPIKTLPDSFSLRHWDIYIDPKQGTVKNIYILKKTTGNKIQQLTWIARKSCNIKTIFEDAGGRPSIEKEITIKWDSN
ncbi:MAG: hypothetical protein ABI581_15535 [Sediminibacterium sp.]